MNYLKYVLLLIVLLTLSTSCVRESDKPEGLISVPDMAMIIKDIQIAEAIVTKASLPIDSAWVLAHYREREIYKSYNVSKEQFTNSYNYYLKHKTLLADIYKIVVDTLSYKHKLIKNLKMKEESDKKLRKEHTIREEKEAEKKNAFYKEHKILEVVRRIIDEKFDIAIDSIDQYYTEQPQRLLNDTLKQDTTIYVIDSTASPYSK